MSDEAHEQMARNVVRQHLNGYEEGLETGLRLLRAGVLSEAAVKAANDALWGSPSGGVRQALEAALDAALGEMQ